MKYIPIITVGLLSFNVQATPLIDPGETPATNTCIFHLSGGATDTYTTNNCDIVYTDGSTSAYANVFEYVPGTTPGYFAALSKWHIEGQPDCIVLSNGKAYSSDNYWNIVQVLKYGTQWTQLTLNCVNLKEFQPE